jgi:hypothetical protein
MNEPTEAGWYWMTRGDKRELVVLSPARAAEPTGLAMQRVWRDGYRWALTIPYLDLPGNATWEFVGPAEEAA